MAANEYGKIQQDNNKIALSSCNHKYLSCHIMCSPYAKLYGTYHQMEQSQWHQP